MNDIDRLVSYSACPNKLGQLEVERWEVEDEETAVATVGAASRNGKVSSVCGTPSGAFNGSFVYMNLGSRPRALLPCEAS
jgi:hypothetical protein